MAIVPRTGADAYFDTHRDRRRPEPAAEPAAMPADPAAPMVDETIDQGADSFFNAVKAREDAIPAVMRSANPPAAREANRLAPFLALPPDTVERNLPEMRSKTLADQWDVATRGNPRLSNYVSDPRRAAASSDDLPALKAISDKFHAFWGKSDPITSDIATRAARENTAAQTADGWFDRALSMGSAGVSGVESGLFTVGAALNEWSADHPLPWTSEANIAEARNNADQLRRRAALLSGVAPVHGATTWQDVKDKPSPGRIGSFVFEQGVQSVPGMITAGVALPAYVASQAGSIGQQRATNNGKRDATIADVLKASPAAVASALLERVGIASIFEAGGKTVLRRVLGAAAGEGATEFAQSVVENAGGTLGTDRGFILSEALDQGLQGAVAGFGMGGVFKAVHENVSSLATRYVETRQAQAGAALLDGVMEDAKASKLRTDDPNAYQDFVQSQAAGTPVENVMIPAEAIRQLYQGEGKDWTDPDDDFLGHLAPDFREQMEAGLASGGDVVLPVGAVAAHLADTPAWEKLRPDARVTPGGMSERQSAAIETDYAEEIAAVEQKVTRQAAQELEAMAPRARVYDSVLSQMRQQGFSINAARAYAEIWAAKYQARSEHMGGDADAFTLFAQSFGGFRSDITARLEPYRKGDNLDVLINAMRKGAEPAKPAGQSLLTRIMEGGGIVDEGGYIASMGGKPVARGGHFGRKRKPLIVERNPSQGSFVSGGEGNTLTPDHWIDALVEEGYFPDATERPAVADLLELIGRELAGNPVHPDQGTSLAADTQSAMATAASDLRQMLDERGIDPDKATRAEIAQAINEAQAESERSLDQAAPESDAFRRWFGESKVVDENGDPLRVYHGTNKNFEAFKGAAWFSRSPALANEFTQGRWGNPRGKVGGSLVPAYLAISNPLDLSGVDVHRSTTPREFAEAVGIPFEELNAETRAAGQAAFEALPDSSNPKAAKFLGVFGVSGWAADADRAATDERDQPLWMYLDSPMIRDALKARGFDGVKIKERLDASPRRPGSVTVEGETWLAFDPKQVKSASGNSGAFDPNDARILHQSGDAKNKRGRIDFMADGRAIIMLFEKRDMSTVLHESAHLWLEEFRADAEGLTSPKVFADWEAVKAWFKANGHDVEEGRPIPTEAHEMWARTMERYFLEGKAPTRALDEVFALFSRWLGKIYRVVKDALVHSKGTMHGTAPITDEVRGVMDRLLATQDAIDAAQATAERYHFANAAEAGMDDQTWSNYSRLVELSRTEAYGSLLEQTMDRMRRAKTAQYKERREKIRLEVAGDVALQPAVRAFTTIKAKDGKGRLSREGVTEVLGKKAIALLPAAVPPVVAKKGFHPDTLAEIVGMPDGRTMLMELIGMEARRKELLAAGDKRSTIDEMIDVETDARMAKQYGDAFDEGRIEEEAKRAIHNSASADLLAAETRQMAKRVGELPAPAKLVKEWAERFVSEGKIADQASAGALARHSRAEQSAGRDYEKALLAQDMDAAYQAKQRQMFAHALFRAASDAKQRVDVIARRLDRLARSKGMKGLDPEYLDRIHELLEDHDLRKRSQKEVKERESFDKWAKRMEEQGVEVVVPERLTLAGNVHFSKMAVADLFALNDAIVNLDHLGREKLRMTVDGQKRDFEEFMHNMTVASEQLPSRKFKAILNQPGNIARQVISSFVTVERMADFMDNYDPNGAFNSVLIKGATDAANRFAAIGKEVIEPVVESYMNMPKAQRKRLFERITVPEFSVIDPDTREIKPLTMLRMDLIAVALNTGTESNLDKMIRGENLQWKNMPDYALTEAKVMEALNRELKAEDWAFVQSLWANVGKLWPHIVESERNITGMGIEKVEPRKVVTAHGEIQGDYWPAVYDTDPNRAKYANFDATKNAEKDAQSLFGQIGRAVATSNGHTITRTEYAAPMLFSLEGILFRHVRRVATRAAYGAWARDALKFVNDGRTEEIVSRKLGKEYYQQFHPWLRDQINDSALDTADIRGIDAILRKARTNATAVGLVYRFTTILTQVFGFANSVAEIGPKHVLDGYLKATINMGAAQKEAVSLSAELSRRAGEFDRDIGAALRDMSNPPSRGTGILASASRALDPAARIKDRFNAFGFHLIGMMQLHAVDIPLWIGAYKKGLAQGMTQAQAINLGDKSVRKAQGASNAKDLAAIQRTGEGYKVLTTFYTFWGTVLNYQWETAQAVRRGDYSRAMSAVFWVMIAGPLMSGYFLSPPDDDEDWASWAARNIFFGLWGGVPIVRDWANKWNREAGGQYAADPSTPAGRVVAGVVATGKDTAKLLSQTEAYEEAQRLASFLPEASQNPPSDKMLKHYMESFGLLTGLGTGQLATTTQYGADLWADKQHPQGPSDVVAGVIKGPQKEQE